jgi:hypothetical protein
MGASVSDAAPLGDASFGPCPRQGAFIAAFSWQPVYGGVMIGAGVSGMTSRVDESRPPKYGRLTAFPEIVWVPEKRLQIVEFECRKGSAPSKGSRGRQDTVRAFLAGVQGLHATIRAMLCQKQRR